MTTSRSPDIPVFRGVEPRTVRQYPLLVEVLQNHKEDFGAVRVFRKSLVEIEALRVALPEEYFESEWVDSDTCNTEVGVRSRYFILWCKTKVENLPPIAQTIIFKII